jgi:hypothetical protein
MERRRPFSVALSYSVLRVKLGAFFFRWCRSGTKRQPLQATSEKCQLLIGIQLSQPIDIGLHGLQVPTSLVVEALCVGHGRLPGRLLAPPV